MPQLQTIEAYLPISVSVDTLIKTGEGRFMRLLCTASSAGVIKVWDSTTASGTVLIDNFPVFAGDIVDMPMQFTTGLFFDLVSGTATVTVLYL